MSSTKVYLVSGANRGLGLGFIQALSDRDDTIIFAGVRDPSKANELHQLAEKFPKKVHIVKLLSANKENNTAAIEEIKHKAGKLDVVIANAGVGKVGVDALNISTESMIEHFTVNTLGTLILFQAAWPLLQHSASPKFIPISSIAGSIAVAPAIPMRSIAYGTSKAALNWVTRKLHFEHPTLVTFPVDPGTVETDMARHVKTTEKELTDTGFFDGISVPLEESVDAILRLTDTATRETHGGVFARAAGGTNEW